MNFAIMVILILLLSFPGHIFAQQNYVMCTTLAPPLSTPQHDGILDAIIAEAFKRSNAVVEFVVTPSERGLVNANSGVADGDVNRVGGLAHTYPNLLQVAESNMDYEFIAFTVRDDLRIEGWGDLKHLSVAFITGWKILEENVVASSVTKVETPTQLFEMLAKGRVDVVIYDRWGGGYYLDKLDIVGARPVDPPLARREMYMYINKVHGNIVPALAESLRAMKQDGTYQLILSRHKAPPALSP